MERENICWRTDLFFGCAFVATTADDDDGGEFDAEAMPAIVMVMECYCCGVGGLLLLLQPSPRVVIVMESVWWLLGRPAGRMKVWRWCAGGGQATLKYLSVSSHLIVKYPPSALSPPTYLLFPPLLLLLCLHVENRETLRELS